MSSCYDFNEIQQLDIVQYIQIIYSKTNGLIFDYSIAFQQVFKIPLPTKVGLGMR